MSSVIEVKNESTIEEEPNADIPIPSSEEQLLGSVTSICEGPDQKGQQLRSSARVFKKMKLDSSTPVIPEKIEKKEENKQDTITKKCYRPLWSSDDKNYFFEALNEFGKDFENIHSYISTKLRKKGVPDHLIKTKDQVRHLYYRTWHKISKYLKLSDGIKKLAQELYGLINYGELRKKVGSVSKKSLLKLNDLLYKGTIILRVKGKSLRVSTPMCRALRKVNQLDEKYDDIKLPNRLTIELRPKDMNSFLRVQSTAQNPRLRTSMPLQKRLSSLIECLNKKWKSVDARIYDKALISTNPVTSGCVPSNKETETNKLLLNPPLRLTPPPDCNVEIPSINFGEYFTRQSICLNSYQSRVGGENFNTFCNYNTFKLGNKPGSRKIVRPRTDSASEKTPPKNNSQTEDYNTDNTDQEPNSDISKAVDNIKQEEITIEETKVGYELGYKKEVFLLDHEMQARIDTIKKGWTEKNSESVTVGEIYLMFGSNSKVILEYSWDKPSKPSGPKTSSNHVSVDTEKDTDSLEDICSDEDTNTDMSDSLSKLLSVAKLHYRSNKINCPCGHVCGAKNNSQLKRAVESKIRKILTDMDKCTDEIEDKIIPEENMFDNETSCMSPPVYVKPKVPIAPAPQTHQPTDTGRLVSQIDSIQKLQPRYCNRRGRRPRLKQVVVERKLPLLPNNLESGHQIVRMNIISKESQTQVATNEKEQPSSSNDHVSRNDILTESMRISDINSEPTSPSRILREGDNQWINSVVGDYSLSSLLGHLESPMKSVNSNLLGEDSRLSYDVGSQLQSMLTQSSVDFSANFADLAAQVTQNEDGNT
ncbi:unnamed protein product [Phaedon cochleariae]|uniref:Uncharacterized protein n=1 Tax=Phaedon cochleariae TaxID=80249 RepID=A0A9N9X0R2_PHACE|nr:unnamed protein product [Phaedon cochleariae]